MNAKEQATKHLAGLIKNNFISRENKMLFESRRNGILVWHLARLVSHSS